MSLFFRAIAVLLFAFCSGSVFAGIANSYYESGSKAQAACEMARPSFNSSMGACSDTSTVSGDYDKAFFIGWSYEPNRGFFRYKSSGGCGSGWTADAQGQCKQTCTDAQENDASGACVAKTPKTPGELIPSNAPNADPGMYAWEDSGVTGPRTGGAGSACYAGHVYSYDSTVCDAHQGAGTYNCTTVNGRYTGEFCGGTVEPPTPSAPPGGGGTGGGDTGGGDTGGGDTGGGGTGGGDTGGGDTGGGDTGGGDTGGGGTGGTSCLEGGNCSVTVNETGTPTGVGTAKQTGLDGIDEAMQGVIDAMDEQTKINALPWSLNFSLPSTSCQPLQWSVFGNEKSFNPCSLFSRVRDALGFLLGGLCLIYLWKRATSATGA